MSTPTAAETTAPAAAEAKPREHHHFRFHLPHLHLHSAFGDDWFALKAEAFARFFGTPVFLVVQTVVVIVWIVLNIAGLTHFDVYPFILLNLAFSLQSAYAAPLILLAQTRQVERDKESSDKLEAHREEVTVAMQRREAALKKETDELKTLLQSNTDLTQQDKELTEKIETLTREIHARLTST